MFIRPIHLYGDISIIHCQVISCILPTYFVSVVFPPHTPKCQQPVNLLKRFHLLYFSIRPTSFHQTLDPSSAPWHINYPSIRLFVHVSLVSHRFQIFPVEQNSIHRTIELNGDQKLRTSQKYANTVATGK